MMISIPGPEFIHHTEVQAVKNAAYYDDEEIEAKVIKLSGGFRIDLYERGTDILIKKGAA